MKGVIDRFEGKFAVVELKDKKMVNVEIDRLSESAREGDCIIFEDDVWVVDRDETKAKKAKIEKLMGDVFK
jgi:hypothetical protein